MGSRVSLQGGNECEVCTKTAIVVEQVLMHNATSGHTFQNAAALLCAHVPREMADTCRTATARLNNKIFECLIKKLEISSVCADEHIDLCITERVSSETDAACDAFDPDPLGCAACEFAVSGLQQYVNDTSSLIVKAVRDDVCNFHFKEPQKQEECSVVLTGFGDVALRVLASRLDAAEFCCDLGLCEAVSAKKEWIKGPIDLNAPN